MEDINVYITTKKDAEPTIVTEADFDNYIRSDATQLEPVTEFLKQNEMYEDICSQIEICGRNVLYFAQNGHIIDTFTLRHDQASLQALQHMPFETVYANMLLSALSTKISAGADLSNILAALAEYNNFKQEKINNFPNHSGPK